MECRRTRRGGNAGSLGQSSWLGSTTTTTTTNNTRSAVPWRSLVAPLVRAGRGPDHPPGRGRVQRRRGRRRPGRSAGNLLDHHELRADHLDGSADDRSEGRGPGHGRHGAGEREGRPRRPGTQGNGQVPVHRPVSCRHRDRPVAQVRSRGPPGQQDHPGGRQGAASDDRSADHRATTADDLAGTGLRSVLPRCLPRPRRRGLRLRGGLGERTEYVDGPVRVRPPDPFDLDREGDGWGCESS